MEAVEEAVEPILSFAWSEIEAALGTEAGDNTLEEAGRALRACAAYLALYVPPAYEAYNAAALLKERLDALADATHIVHIGPVEDCVGDKSQVFECLRLLARAAGLEPESLLVVEVFQQGEIPCIGLGFDGPGRIPPEIAIEGLLVVSMDELKGRWTLATRGGRIDTAPNGLVLRLKGMRLAPEVTDRLEPVRVLVEQGLGHCAQGDGAAALSAVDAALTVIDGEERPKEPADLKALVAEVVRERAAELEARSITIETLFASPVPAIPVNRNRLRTFFARAFEYAIRGIPGTGSVVLLVDYAKDRRAVDMVISIEGVSPDRLEAIYPASLRRAIVDAHEGACDLVVGEKNVTITVALPDPVGRALDEWMPGFEVFSERSKQVLRLLKSGGAALPKELLLAGVLEEELQRWLLPKLSEPPAMNLAHNLSLDAPGPPGSLPERRRKALTQIRRGKPRKELAEPAYAAEILWAYRVDERHRAAIGVERLDSARIERLCALLLQKLPDYVECLRLIAREHP